MVGFVSLEELKNQPDADRAFTRVLADYPDSDVVPMAKYMLENIDQPPPKFDDLEELGDKINNESD